MDRLSPPSVDIGSVKASLADYKVSTMNSIQDTWRYALYDLMKRFAT